MDFAEDFTGKTTLVTGAGTGIGKAIALGLGQAGATVLCTGRTESKVEHTAEIIRSHGAKAWSISLDVTDPVATAALADEIESRHEALDIAYLNAGGHAEIREIVDSDVDRWRYDVELNMFSIFYGIKYFAPLMKKRGGGKIIFTGSGLGHLPRDEYSSYCSGKAGARMIARVAATELAKDNVTVNELIPGPVVTPLTAANISLDGGGPPFQHPNEWVKQPEDVVALALSMAALPGKGPTGQIFSLMRR